MLIHQFLDIMPTGSLPGINSSFKNDIWPLLKMLCYAIAGLLGLIAGLRIYNLWNLVVATAFINVALM